MVETNLTGAPSGEDGYSPRAGGDEDLAAWARYEREAAALDLSDAEQAYVRSVPQPELAAELYVSADRHRRLAGRLEAGDTSAVLDVGPVTPVSPDEL